MRLIASILLALAILALPMYPATGLVCVGCPTGFAGAGGHAGDDGDQAAVRSGCGGCHCDVGASKGEINEGAGEGESDPGSEGPDEPSSHGCDCPLRCVCGAAKLPILVNALKCPVAFACVYELFLPCNEAMLSDPHLKRLKRPPRFTGSC